MKDNIDKELEYLGLAQFRAELAPPNEYTKEEDEAFARMPDKGFFWNAVGTCNMLGNELSDLHTTVVEKMTEIEKSLREFGVIFRKAREEQEQK